MSGGGIRSVSYRGRVGSGGGRRVKRELYSVQSD